MSNDAGLILCAAINGDLAKLCTLTVADFDGEIHLLGEGRAPDLVGWCTRHYVFAFPSSRRMVDAILAGKADPWPPAFVEAVVKAGGVYADAPTLRKVFISHGFGRLLQPADAAQAAG